MPTDEQMDQMLSDPDFVMDGLPEDVQERLRERRSYKEEHEGLYAKPAKKFKAQYKQNSYTKNVSGGSFMTSEGGLSDISLDVAERRLEADNYNLNRTMQRDHRHRPVSAAGEESRL